MKIRLITVTRKIPPWVKLAYNEYIKRLPRQVAVQLVEITPIKRTPTTTVRQILFQEGEKILRLLNPEHVTIALDLNGQSWSSLQFATIFTQSDKAGTNLDFIIGGADGLDVRCIHKADHAWSLSALTFPHALVQVIVIEQIYRAYSIAYERAYHR